MKKKLIRAAIILCVLQIFPYCFQVALCQPGKQKGNFFQRRFISSAGVNYFPEDTNIPSAAGINFSPQLFLTTSFTDFSVSVKADFMLNYHLLNKENNAGQILFFQLPSMIYVNFGHLASKDFYNALGAFIGAGWNLQYGESRTANGFAVEAGFRFWLLGKSITLSFTDLPGDEKIFSSGKIISLQINLGKYLNDARANKKLTDFMKPYNKK